MGYGLHEGWPARQAPPRLQADRRQKHGQRGGAGAGRDDDHRPQNARGLRPLPHREPSRSEGRRHENFGVDGHVFYNAWQTGDPKPIWDILSPDIKEYTDFDTYSINLKM